jgi:hypothetical protein
VTRKLAGWGPASRSHSDSTHHLGLDDVPQPEALAHLDLVPLCQSAAISSARDADEDEGGRGRDLIHLLRGHDLSISKKDMIYPSLREDMACFISYESRGSPMTTRTHLMSATLITPTKSSLDSGTGRLFTVEIIRCA